AGCSPSSIRSVPIMCATLSRTVQPGHSVGASHCASLKGVHTSVIDDHTVSSISISGSVTGETLVTLVVHRTRRHWQDRGMERIEFHFDPMCPWAYQTSKWIRSVRDQVDIEIDWRFLSLEEINRAEGKRHPWDRPWSYGFGQMRVGAWLRRRSMDDVDRWY